MFRLLFFLFLYFQVNTVAAQPLYFPPVTGNVWDTISPQSLGYCQSRIDSLYAFLENNNTKAFILLKNGKIVLEKYFGTHTQNTPWQWASAGKTIMAFLVGIARQEGYLNITDTTSSYLGKGWTNCTATQEDKITIRHQLTMTTGLDDAVADPTCTLDTCLIYKADAGTRWAYHNAPYTLLEQVLENATGKSLNIYTNQKLKNLTGMSGSFLTFGYNRVFYSNARSMARFGLLMLNKGNWDGIQILTDTLYFNQMISTSQMLNQSYGYLWWLNGKQSYMVPTSQMVFQGPLFPNAPSDMISAMGKGGQFLNIVPSQNLIWLRMGEDPSNVPVPFLLNNLIWNYINALPCTTTHTEEQNSTNRKLDVFPNPADDLLCVKSDIEISAIELLNLQGQLLISKNPSLNEIFIDLSKISKGTYVLKVYFSDETMQIKKISVVK
ncbi:MAG: serine hydrolase [Thermaurantimonas sp.]|uniref:serine hydrolase n=1 Tax=Thermaurantimonas sp. TaxID=2681568 RepID=UPI00391A524E